MPDLPRKPPEIDPAEKERRLQMVVQYLVSALQTAGVETLVIGLSVDDSPQGAGLVKVVGNATLCLNLVAALIHALRPEDFHPLLLNMLHGEYFAELRGDNIKAKTPQHGPN
jgi:hypothetical protein